LKGCCFRYAVSIEKKCKFSVGEIKELKEKEKKRKLCLIGVGYRIYKIGRVNYIVSASFKVFDTFFGTSLRDLVAHSLKSGLIDLTEKEVCDNMDSQGYACSEVDRGKEETE